MLKEFFRLLPKATAIWLIAFVLSQALSVYFNHPLISIFILWKGFLWLVGVGLMLGLLLSLFGKDHRLLRVTLFLLALNILNLFFFYGERISVLTYFFLHKGQYDGVVAKVIASPECPSVNTEDQYRIECGSQRKVVFFMPAGGLFTVQGVVYDPTGQILQFRSDYQLRVQFGMEPISAEHLYSDWYYCLFTS